MIGGPLDALENAVDAAKSSVMDDATFKNVQTVLPSRSSGIFFMNVSELEKLIATNFTGSARTDYQRNTQPWLKPIKAIGLASDTSAPDATLTTLFVYIRGE